MKALPFLEQVLTLLRIELVNWRWSWRGALVLDTLAPLLSMLGLGLFARDLGIGTLGYVFTGNVVLGLMFGNMRKIGSHVSFLTTTGGLDYFATLPVGKLAFVVAIILAFFLMALPSALMTLLAGAFLMGIPLQISPLLPVVLLLTAVPLAGLGAYISVSARNAELASALNLIITMLLTGLGPVVVPPERMPAIINTLSVINPARYAASALRQTVMGPVTADVGIDLAALIGFTALVLVLLVRRIDWRAEE